MNGIERIAAERQRQIDAEGWTAEHDDAERAGALTDAAGCYCGMAATILQNPGHPDHYATECPPSTVWPWDASAWKPSADPIRNLEKAGALIAAEIDRLLRAESEGSGCGVEETP